MKHNTLSQFIAKTNSIDKNFVGYCGTNPVEVEKALTDFDFPLEVSFSLLQRDDQIYGALGFDIDLENKQAEVWGPFISSNDWVTDAQTLWKNSLKKLPKSLNSFHFFYEKKNSRAVDFAYMLGAKKNLSHFILCLKKENFLRENLEGYMEIKSNDFLSFSQLHDSLFPKGYFSGKQILKKLSPYHKVFIVKQNLNCIGYIYVEVVPEFSEGKIHFFGVEEKYRKQGLGSKLLKIGINWIFQFMKINEISLCVDDTNLNAIKIYKDVGFNEIHRCLHLRLFFYK